MFRSFRWFPSFEIAKVFEIGAEKQLTAEDAEERRDLIY
jgi:hypothetical protein